MLDLVNERALQEDVGGVLNVVVTPRAAGVGADVFLKGVCLALEPSSKLEPGEAFDLGGDARGQNEVIVHVFISFHGKERIRGPGGEGLPPSRNLWS